MNCNHSLIELNRQREKEGLPPLNRRMFCKLATASSLFLGMSGLFGCEQSGGLAGGCGGPTEEGDGGSDYVKAKVGQDTRAEFKIIPGVELDDYSGPFRPDLRITDFSRELLARMYPMYHQYDLNMIMGYQVFEMGQGEGILDYSAGTAMQLEVWSYDLAVAARAIQMKYLNTSGSGIDSFLKAVQVDITAQQPNFDNNFEMPDENTGIYTFNKCFGITMMEKTGGSVEQIEDTCALDPPAIGNSCDMYSNGLVGKKIHLDIITMPPRRYADEVCCQWKFTYV